jgi:hypothetical protein
MYLRYFSVLFLKLNGNKIEVYMYLYSFIRKENLSRGLSQMKLYLKFDNNVEDFLMIIWY